MLERDSLDMLIHMASPSTHIFYTIQFIILCSTNLHQQRSLVWSNSKTGIISGGFCYGTDITCQNFTFLSSRQAKELNGNAKCSWTRVIQRRRRRRHREKLTQVPSCWNGIFTPQIKCLLLIVILWFWPLLSGVWFFEWPVHRFCRSPRDIWRHLKILFPVSNGVYFNSWGYHIPEERRSLVLLVFALLCTTCCICSSMWKRERQQSAATIAPIANRFIPLFRRNPLPLLLHSDILSLRLSRILLGNPLQRL